MIILLPSKIRFEFHPLKLQCQNREIFGRRPQNLDTLFWHTYTKVKW